jgi:hypothetical protein
MIGKANLSHHANVIAVQQELWELDLGAIVVAERRSVQIKTRRVTGK